MYFVQCLWRHDVSLTGVAGGWDPGVLLAWTHVGRRHHHGQLQQVSSEVLLVSGHLCVQRVTATYSMVIVVYNAGQN